MAGESWDSTGIGRRSIVAALISGCVPKYCESGERSDPLTITCFIHYEIDPYQREAFKTYAQNWGRIIPRCGGHLIGYFLPDEGTNFVGWGLIAFDSLASYERYRVRLRNDPEGRENFRMAQEKRFIVREERTFLETVEGTLGIPAKQG